MHEPQPLVAAARAADDVYIGDNVVISPEGKPDNMDHPLYFIRDGIVIIPKDGFIPHGTVI